MAPSPVTRGRQGIQTEFSGEWKKYLESMKEQIIASFERELKEVKESISILGTRMLVMEEGLKNMKSDICRIDSEINSLKTKGSTQFPPPNVLFENILHEFNQMEMRKKNVIISGIPEKEDGSLQERADHDKEQCEEILEELDLSSIEIRSLRRIGKLRKDGKRLLKVEFFKTSDKREVLKRSKKLKEGHFVGIFINPDRTPMEQKQFKDLRDELRRRRDDGEDVIIFRGSVIPKQSITNFH